LHRSCSDFEITLGRVNLLVKVASFFRDAEAFYELRLKVICLLEEARSHAKVFDTCIDEDALQNARTGIYAESGIRIG